MCGDDPCHLWAKEARQWIHQLTPSEHKKKISIVVSSKTNSKKEKKTLKYLFVFVFVIVLLLLLFEIQSVWYFRQVVRSYNLPVRCYLFLTIFVFVVLCNNLREIQNISSVSGFFFFFFFWWYLLSFQVQYVCMAVEKQQQ